MKSDPPATAFFDVFDECSLRRWRPTIRRVVKLDEKLIVGQEFIVDFFGVLDVVDGEVILCRQLIQPGLCGFHEMARESRRVPRWRQHETAALLSWRRRVPWRPLMLKPTRMPA
jgi:hypothetical protein